MMNFADPLQLTTYPSWVRYTMWGIGLAWFITYSGLVAFKPPAPREELRVDRIRWAVHGPTGQPALIVQVRNTTKAPATISELRLAIGTRPSGGLMTSLVAQQSYIVVSGENPNQILSRPLGGSFSIDGSISQPFAGQSFWDLKVPVVENVDDQKGLSFVVIFDKTLADRINDRTATAVLIYNGNFETQPVKVL